MTQIIEISQQSGNNRGNNRKEKVFPGLLVVVLLVFFFRWKIPDDKSSRMTRHPLSISSVGYLILFKSALYLAYTWINT